jgi:hypothetical protein
LPSLAEDAYIQAMRLIGVIIGTLFAVNMALGTVYFRGLSRVHPKYEHSFFDGNQPWIVLPLSWSKELSAYPSAIVWIDVGREKNQTLLALGADQKNETAQALSEVISKLGDRKMILNITINGEDIDRQMLAFIKSINKQDQILIQSEFDIILRAMKDQDANHPYGSSQSDRLRFNTFKGMALWEDGLLPATPFKGDVYISPLKWKNVSLIDEHIQNELRRRQKMSILGPLISQEEVNQAERLKPAGYYFGTKEAFNYFVQLHP